MFSPVFVHGMGGGGGRGIHPVQALSGQVLSRGGVDMYPNEETSPSPSWVWSGRGQGRVTW